MKRIALLLATAAIAAPLSVASAADAYDPAFDWTGPYVGFVLGADIVDFDSSIDIPAASNMNAGARAAYNAAANFSDKDMGMLAGITAGANWQNNNFVLGVEGDASYLFGGPEASNSASPGATANVTNSLDEGFFGTLRARGGLASGNTFYFLTGGLAYSGSDVEHTMNWSFADGCPVVSPGFQECHVGGKKVGLGWTVGAGIEHAFSQSMTIKAEYLYADFGDADFRTTSIGVGPSQFVDHSTDVDMHILRVGLNWHF